MNIKKIECLKVTEKDTVGITDATNSSLYFINDLVEVTLHSSDKIEGRIESIDTEEIVLDISVNFKSRYKDISMKRIRSIKYIGGKN